MHYKIYYLFSIIFIILSIFISFFKGYFAVREYFIDRNDIKIFLEKQDKIFNSFIFVSQENIKDKVRSNFEDIEDLTTQKNYFNFTVKVKLKTKTPKFSTNIKGLYIDSTGAIFKSNIDLQSSSAVVTIFDKNKKQVFEKNEVDFISQIKDFPDISIKCNERYFEVRLNNFPNIYIEVYKVSDSTLLAKSLNGEIEKVVLKNTQTVFLVLDNKIVIKK